MTNSKSQVTEECCPVFDLVKWDDRIFNWDRKQFIKSSIPTLFHIPFPPMIGKAITKMTAQAEKSRKLLEQREDILVLFTDPHPFKSEIYLSVTGTVPDANNTTITGAFASRVFDGRYNEIPKFIKDMDAELQEKGKKPGKYYVHYAYCPKCAKEQGHNYMVLFAEIQDLKT